MTLNYAHLESAARRPGSWIVLGIISLLIGGLSVLANFFVGVIWLNAGIQSIPPGVTPYVLPFPQLTPVGTEYVGPRGLDRAERARRIDGFALPDDVTRDDRVAMLDRLLAECGQDIFLGPNAANPRPEVDRTGASPGQSSDERRKAFIVPTGTIEISTTEAAFVRPAKLTAVYETTVFESSGTFREPWPRRVSAFTVGETIGALRVSNPALTPYQLATVADLIATVPVQAPPRYQMPHPGVQPVSLTPEQLLSIKINAVTHLVLGDGRTLPADQVGLGVDPLRGTVYPLPPPFRPSLPGSPALMFAQAAHCGVTLLMALLLMFGGFRMLADSADGAVLHYRWAWCKLALIVVEVTLVMFFVLSIGSDSRSAVYFSVSGGMTWTALSVAVQAIYPVVVLAIIQAPATRKYVQSKGVTVGLADYPRWALATQWLAASQWRRVAQGTGIAMVVIAVLHAISAVAAGVRQDWTPGLFHALLAIMIIAAGRWCLKLRQAAAVATVLVLMALPSLAIAQVPSAATQPAAVDQAVRQKAISALKVVGPQKYNERSRIVADVARLGEPAVGPLMDFFSANAENERMVSSAILWWDRLRLANSPTFRSTVASYAPRFMSRNTERAGRQLMRLIADEPGLLPYWETLCFSNDSDISEAAANYVLALDPTARGVVDWAGKQLRNVNRNSSRENAMAVLFRLGPVGQDAARSLLKDRDPGVRLLVANSIGERRSTGGTLDQTDIAAAVELVVRPFDGINEQERDDAMRVKLQRAGMNLLVRSDEQGKRRALDLLNTEELPEAADRNLVLAVLAEVRLPLRELITKGRPKHEWAAVQKVAVATLASTGQHCEPLVTLLEDGDISVRNMAVRMMAKIATRRAVPADDMLSKIDTQEATVRTAAFALLNLDTAAWASPRAQALFAEQLRTRNPRALDAFIDLFKNSPPVGKLALIDLVYVSKLPMTVPARIYGQFRGTRPSRFAERLGDGLFDEKVWSDPAAETSHQLLRHMAAGGTPDEAARDVLRNDPKATQTFLASLLLTNSIAEVLGPATRAAASSAAGVPMPPPPARAVTEYWPDTQWSPADTRLFGLAGFTWAATAIVGLATLLLGGIAFAVAFRELTP
ncbi:MAG TPA: hypothetical protein VF595_07605 [Tepidisphaeraceae bacterium]